MMAGMGEALAMFSQPSRALSISILKASAWLGQSHVPPADPSQKQQVSFLYAHLLCLKCHAAVVEMSDKQR